MNTPTARQPEHDEDRVAVFLRAVATGDRRVVDAMLESAPTLVSAAGPHPFWGGRPQALHVAVESGRLDTVQRLLDAGADASGLNDAYDHWSPLMLAVHRRRDDVRDELLRRGARVGLAESLMLGDDVLVDTILASAPLPQVVPNDGSFVAFARTPGAIDRLIAAGASATTPDRWGTTPAVAFGRLGAQGAALVRHLATHGASVDAAVFARLGDQDTIATLTSADRSIAARADVVLAAVEGGHHALTGWLLDRGASSNARATDRSRQTLLHIAAWRGDLPMAELLVARGADVTALDEEHKATPREWAETAVTVTNNPRCVDVVAWFDRQATR